MNNMGSSFVVLVWGVVQQNWNACQLNACNPILLYVQQNWITTKVDHVTMHDVTVQIQIQNKNAQLN